VRVSVVVPVYNAEPYVEAAIRSVLASDLHELEILVVDDGSTDMSASIVASIDDPRVVLIRLRPSGKPSRPRNVGVARARAPYVAFLDADDLIKSDKLSASVRELDQHPEAGFVFADFERIDDAGNVICDAMISDFPGLQKLLVPPTTGDWHVIPQERLARGLLYENFIGTSGVVVRKQLLTEIGPFDESTVYSEDLDLWFRLAHRCDALYSPRIGHSYRDCPESLTYGPPARNARDRITVLLRERARWTDKSALQQLNRLIAENLAGIGYWERIRGRRTRSIAMFAWAFTTSPRVRWLRAMLGSLRL
jgi:glycosyltransferase involved in cell wall biosynthesis